MVQQVGDRLVDQESDYAVDRELQCVERQECRNDQCHDLRGGHVRIERRDDDVTYDRRRERDDSANATSTAISVPHGLVNR